MPAFSMPTVGHITPEKLVSSVSNYTAPTVPRNTAVPEITTAAKHPGHLPIIISLSVFLGGLFLGLSVYAFFCWYETRKMFSSRTLRPTVPDANGVEIGPLPQCISAQSSSVQSSKDGMQTVDSSERFHNVDLERGESAAHVVEHSKPKLFPKA
ncbi:hypothetical protein P280DRAFT_39478 [Massarina eburnea CBS 473.64]|uniref:Uncharacterized protein n=1 Tax=Massarina eburnea CBS 473.64 TaxID=1395130 RepID=A0A6A6RWZ0_9PLEO|nr:hypothetical protein P280DRAFT_39478 [Massarina eburnea CBS 473.64]